MTGGVFYVPLIIIGLLQIDFHPVRIFKINWETKFVFGCFLLGRAMNKFFPIAWTNYKLLLFILYTYVLIKLQPTVSEQSHLNHLIYGIKFSLPHFWCYALSSSPASIL